MTSPHISIHVSPRKDIVDDVFYTEIGQQPAALLRAAAALPGQAPAFSQLAEAARNARRVVLTGMGASYDACLAAASVLGVRGMLVPVVNTAELLHFRSPALQDRTLVVVVSQSGRSAEPVRLAAKLPGSMLVSLTNGTGNPLAAAAGIALDTAAGPELGPSTLSFAATFPALSVVAGILTGEDPATAIAEAGRQANATAARIERVLIDATAIADRAASWLGDRRSVVLVGRGTARAAADLGALVLKEAAHLPAECLDAAEFRHGPMELAGPGLAVAVVATEPATYHLDYALAEEVAAHGGSVLLISADGTAPPGVTAIAVGPCGDRDRLLAPAVEAVPFQLLAHRLAVTAGGTPGQFTVGSKITTKE